MGFESVEAVRLLNTAVEEGQGDTSRAIRIAIEKQAAEERKLMGNLELKEMESVLSVEDVRLKLAHEARDAEAAYAEFTDGGLVRLRPDMTADNELGHTHQVEKVHYGPTGPVLLSAQGQYVTTKEYMKGLGPSFLRAVGGMHVDDDGIASGHDDVSVASLAKIAGKNNDLAAMTKSTSHSRFIGKGPLVAVIDPYSVRGLTKNDIDEEAQQLSSSSSIGGLMMSSSMAKSNKTAGISELRSDELGELTRLNAETGERAGIDLENKLQRREPAYIEDIKKATITTFAATLPDAVKGAVAKIADDSSQQAQVARMPPGLDGARRGAAAAAIALAKAKGTVGTTGVLRTKSMGREDDTSALAEAGLRARLTQLENKIATVAAETELAQYGALTKPVLDGAATLMMHLTAADGTATLMDRVAAVRADQAATRDKKISEVSKKRDDILFNGGKPHEPPPPVENSIAQSAQLLRVKSEADQHAALLRRKELEDEADAISAAMPRRGGSKARRIKSRAEIERLRQWKAEAERAKDAEKDAEDETRDRPRGSSGLFSLLTSLGSSQMADARALALAKIGLTLTKATSADIDPGKLTFLRRATSRVRAKQGAAAGSRKPAQDIWDILDGATEESAIEMGSPPKSVPAEDLAATSSAARTPAVGETRAERKIWGFPDEIVQDAKFLKAEMYRSVPFDTKASSLLGRRHLQVHEEAALIAAREAEEREAAAAAAASAKAKEEADARLRRYGY
jgi:hypothetical protein